MMFHFEGAAHLSVAKLGENNLKINKITNQYVNKTDQIYCKTMNIPLDINNLTVYEFWNLTMVRSI
jgi:hypothetical protein